MGDDFIVVERGAPGTARASFICEPCFDKGKMPEPIELPVASRKCPLCGKAKGLQRIWAGAANAPRLSTAEGRTRIAVNELAGPELDRQHNQRAAALHAQAHSPLGVRIVGMGGLSRAVADATGGAIPSLAVGADGVAKPKHPGFVTESGVERKLGGPQPLLAAKPYNGDPS